MTAQQLGVEWITAEQTLVLNYSSDGSYSKPYYKKYNYTYLYVSQVCKLKNYVRIYLSSYWASYMNMVCNACAYVNVHITGFGVGDNGSHWEDDPRF